MALLDSKQLNPKLTGSFTLSGSIAGSSTTTFSGGTSTFTAYGGNVSGSATSTGSFGTLETAGEINASGRIYEAGSSVIDHATAMAIVFGG